MNREEIGVTKLRKQTADLRGTKGKRGDQKVEKDQKRKNPASLETDNFSEKTRRSGGKMSIRPTWMVDWLKKLWD